MSVIPFEKMEAEVNLLPIVELDNSDGAAAVPMHEMGALTDTRATHAP
jgi:hypothetical protein